MNDEAEVSEEVEETLERLSRALKKSTAHDCPEEKPTAPTTSEDQEAKSGDF